MCFFICDIYFYKSDFSDKLYIWFCWFSIKTLHFYAQIWTSLPFPQWIHDEPVWPQQSDLDPASCQDRTVQRSSHRGDVWALTCLPKMGLVGGFLLPAGLQLSVHHLHLSKLKSDEVWSGVCNCVTSWGSLQNFCCGKQRFVQYCCKRSTQLGLILSDLRVRMDKKENKSHILKSKDFLKKKSWKSFSHDSPRWILKSETYYCFGSDRTWNKTKCSVLVDLQQQLPEISELFLVPKPIYFAFVAALLYNMLIKNTMFIWIWQI